MWTVDTEISLSVIVPFNISQQTTESVSAELSGSERARLFSSIFLGLMPLPLRGSPCADTSKNEKRERETESPSKPQLSIQSRYSELKRALILFENII